MTALLYLHGFASSPHGQKAVALATELAPRGIELIRPDLNVPSFRLLDFDAIVARASEEYAKSQPSMIVGSSLGAIVALTLAARGARVPLVLIAPALGMAERWREKTPPGDPVVVFNHAEGADRPIHRHFFEQMMGVDVDEQPPRVRTVAIMGTLDETVPFESVATTWRTWDSSGRLGAGSELIAVEGGDHGLTAHVPLIAATILRVLGVSS